MWTFADYKESLEKVDDEYRALEKLLPWLKKHNKNDAYKLYANAHSARFKFLVCGRTRINSTRGRIAGNSIEEIDLTNLGATNHRRRGGDRRSAFTGSGSILHYNTNWHFLKNDSWILGGIHAHAEFHLASPRHKNNLVDPVHGFLTVTGREIVGLSEFGYKFFKVGKMGQEIAYCDDEKLADDACFSGYWEAINRQQNGRALDLSLIDNGAKLVDPSKEDVRIWERNMMRYLGENYQNTEED